MDVCDTIAHRMLDYDSYTYIMHISAELISNYLFLLFHVVVSNSDIGQQQQKTDLKIVLKQVLRIGIRVYVTQRIVATFE